MRTRPQGIGGIGRLAAVRAVGDAGAIRDTVGDDEPGVRRMLGLLAAANQAAQRLSR